MNTVTVSSYEDLKGDQVSSASEKDTILMLLRGESDRSRVFRADEWLWTDKSLETHPRHETLVPGHIEAETEKAYLVSQLSELTREELGIDEPGADDPQTDWVPKSVVRVYKPAEGGVTNTTPQKFLGDYE